MKIPTREIPDELAKLEAFFNKSRAAAAKLSESERRDLYQMVQGPGWRVLLRMMEQECRHQEGVCINTPSENDKKVVAEQTMARGFWLFFKRLQDQMQHEIEELFADVNQAIEEMELEENLR